MVNPVCFDNMETIDPSYIPSRRAIQEEAMRANLERVGMGGEFASRREIYVVPIPDQRDTEEILRTIPEVQVIDLGEEPITSGGITRRLRNMFHIVWVWLSRHFN